MSKPTLIAIKGRPNWYILHRGKRISTGTPDKLGAFAELERYRKGTPAAHRAGPRTLEELLEKWSEAYREKAGAGARWKKKWRFVVSTLNRHAGWLTLDRITREWSVEYREARHAEGVQSAAIRQELGLVSAAWRKHGPGDPPDFDRPPEAEARDVWLTKEQAGALVDACQAPHLRLFVHLALATAGRSGALLRLTWSAVDLEKGLVDLRRAGLPGGKRHSHVPVSNEALEELCDAKKVAKT